MPEYQTPGVYIQEDPFGSKPIVGVSTGTAAFVGPACAGPLGLNRNVITSLKDFEATYGDGRALQFGRPNGGAACNFLWHAARAFFAEGGKQLYVARVFRPLDSFPDGSRPASAEYETGLKALEDIDDISIVAAPGSTYGYENAGYRAEAETIVNLLVAHAARMRYRIAVLDSGDGQSVAAIAAMRSTIDSSYAALYYPWLRVLDPATGTEITLPPSGFVSGIYARNDEQRGVSKAPANQPVTLAVGLEQILTRAQQDVLNPGGINCFRLFPGRGILLWGSRTATSDPEWKYVNLRRYAAYLEHSIDRGTQWAVFEPNGNPLWAKIRGTIEDFLQNEWQSGALLGNKSGEAFFVHCDRSTMTQNDLDNGRLIVLIGVALLRPAEFAIFRIGQWTADHKT